MQINHLSLTNFRNFRRLDLRPNNGVTLLHGANAQGKTNLLESIYYLATTRTPYTNQDDQLIHWNAGDDGMPIVVGRLVADITTQTERHTLELRLIRENGSFRREALVNRRKVRLLDLLGHLRVVLFVPTDLDLVTGSPASRRRYLDITLCQRDRVYCRTLSQYNKVLEQRNALLRQIGESGRGRDTLPLYTEQLVELGSVIFATRAKLLRSMAREVRRIHYEQLTAAQESLRLLYHPQIETGDIDRVWLYENMNDLEAIKERFRHTLNAVEAHDLRRGVTSVGIHRDDWAFEVDGRSLRHFGSRGQQRSAVVALKLAEIEIVMAETGESPILLLDDVMAELDGTRRGHLLTALEAATQAFITTADLSVFPAEFQQSSTVYEVISGRLQM